MKATVVFLLQLAFLSALHSNHPLVAACPNLPSMSVEDACRTATGTPLMHDLCKDAMRDIVFPFPNSSVDLYALVAAKRAVTSYDDTARVIGNLLEGGASGSLSLTGDEMDAYELCAGAYTQAGGTMHGIADALVACRFGDDLAKMYRDCILQLETCRDRLLKLTSSPLYAMNLVDRNKAVLAYFVGRLLGVQ